MASKSAKTVQQIGQNVVSPIPNPTPVPTKIRTGVPESSSNLALIVVISVMFIITIYVIFYVWRTYNSTSLKTVTMTKSPIHLTEMGGGFKNLSADVVLPSMYNGNEFSYSFWTYVNSSTGIASNTNKFILGRMTDTDLPLSGNPLFYMDSTSNKLYAYVNTKGSPVELLSDMGTSENTLTIEYMPIHRWVNIVLVVDNNFIQLFMDGELRQVKDLSGENKLVLPTQGNMVAGGDGSFDGYLCKVQCFNYALSIDHAKIVYKAGPLQKSILAAIGVPNYGVRAPFYRVDTDMELK
jgi:hypothetical protein